jgi:hypothetical protein
VRARIEYGSFLIHILSHSQKVLIEKIQFKALKMALGQRFSIPANILLGEAKTPPLEIRFLYLAHNFVTRILTHTLEGKPSEHRVGTVPLTEALRDIVP